TCTVWVGLDTPEKIMQGGYGGTLALPVWVEVMKAADQLGYKAGNIHKKTALVEVRLCRQSGKRATRGCEAARSAYTDNVPVDLAPSENDFCPIHPVRAVPVDEDVSPDAGNSAEQQPSDRPLRAQPVEEIEEETDAPLPYPLRAQPVEEE
ncbi:MAG TPA: hypothetical protein VIM57_10440, partial [Luteolibacter sp.]